MVLGKTIHLSGVTRADFLQEPSWVAHEMCHIRQVQDLGLLRFLWEYLLESARVGYYANRFEVEAREAGRRDAAHYAALLRVALPAGAGRGASEAASAGHNRPDVVV